MGDLEISFNTLLESMEGTYRVNVVSVNPYTDVVYNAKQAETAIIFNLCALSEVGNTKNNLIGVSLSLPLMF